MPLFKNGLETAVAEVKRLREARSKLEEREQSDHEELERLRASLPELALMAALDEEPEAPEIPGLPRGVFHGARGASSKMSMLRSSIEQCQAAMTALFPRLDAAMKAVQIARASEIRKKIAKLQTDLAAHRAQSEKLLTALQNHESALYAPTPMMLVGEIAGPALPMPMPNVTRTAKLQQEIAKLEDEADVIEQRQVNIGGSANDASNFEELLHAIEQVDDTTTIPPTRRAVEAFYREAFARADAEWNGTGRVRGDREPGAAELSGLEDYRTLQISLIWKKDGVIDVEHSTVQYSNHFVVPRELAAQRFGAEYVRAVGEV